MKIPAKKLLEKAARWLLKKVGEEIESEAERHIAKQPPRQP